MTIDREKARAAGYSDEEIDAFEAEEAQRDQGSGEAPPPPPPDADQGEASGPSFGEVASTVVAGAAPYAVPVGLGAAGLYGAAKVGGWGNNLAKSAQGISQAMNQRTAVEAAREARMSSGGAYGRTPTATPSVASKTTTPGPRVSYNVPTQTMPSTQSPVSQMARPVSAPVAPSAAPVTAPAAAPAQPGILQRGMDYASKMREIAANKVMSNAGMIGKATLGAAAALTPSNVGQQYNFPTKGPFAGQEINPMTGRPWTPEELAQYR
jgi:hypothetical protein